MAMSNQNLSIKISPAVVFDMKGLDKAVSNEEKVILVNNKDLFSAIKKNVDKDSRFSKNSKNTLLVSTGLIGAGVVCAMFTPLIIPGAIAVVAGIYGTAGGGIAKAISAIKGKLRKYKWVESDDKKILILIKTVGDNKFDANKESIDFENVRNI